MIANLKKWFGNKSNKKPIQESENVVEDLELLQKQLETELSILMYEWRSLQKKLEVDNQITLDHNEELELRKILFENNQHKSEANNLKFAFFLINQAESLVKDEIKASIKEEAQKKSKFD